MLPIKAIQMRPKQLVGLRQQLWPSGRTGGEGSDVFSSACCVIGPMLFACLLYAVPADASDRKSGEVAGDERPFPTASTTGVPTGWIPKTTYTQDLRITEAGAVIEDVRIRGADLLIDAENVTIRRVEIEGGYIVNDPANVCRNGLLLEDVSIVYASGQTTTDTDKPVIGPGGYTARRTKIDGRPEGFRVGGKSLGCEPVIIEDSFARIVAPETCFDWHGDGIQGYDGPALTVRNVTLELVERSDCRGTAPFFYPADQGNTSVDIDGLLVKGGGLPFRLGMPGQVKGLRIVAHSWGYKPIDVNCHLVDEWEAKIVEVEEKVKSMSVMLVQKCGSDKDT